MSGTFIHDLGRTEEGICSPGVGVRGSCEPPEIDAVEGTKASWKDRPLSAGTSLRPQ